MSCAPSTPRVSLLRLARHGPHPSRRVSGWQIEYCSSTVRVLLEYSLSTTRVLWVPLAYGLSTTCSRDERALPGDRPVRRPERVPRRAAARRSQRAGVRRRHAGAPGLPPVGTPSTPVGTPSTPVGTPSTPVGTPSTPVGTPNPAAANAGECARRSAEQALTGWSLTGAHGALGG